MAHATHPLAVLLLATAPAAQSHLFTFEGDARGDELGASVAFAGDVDGDGRADILVGAPGGGGGAGYARLHAGASGSVLGAWSGAAGAGAFGSSVAGGDLDGDGRGDVVVGDPYGSSGGALVGRVHVFDGPSGERRYALLGAAAGDEYGWAVAVVGDVDLDGFSDLAVGAPQGSWSAIGPGLGLVQLVAGATGDLLRELQALPSTNAFGYSVAAAGDLDADGVADVAVGGPVFDVHMLYGHAWVFSGSDGTELLEAQGELYDILFGASVAGAGDLDADGVVDLSVGTPANYVSAFSGALGTELYTLYGAPDYQSYSVAAAGDVDADGLADVVAGGSLPVGPTDTGSVRVLSGPSGEIVLEVAGSGLSVAGGADVNGDGVPDLVSGALPWSGTESGAGLVRVLSGTELALAGDAHQVSLAAGGSQGLALSAPGSAGLVWVVLGSASGTQPGLDLGAVLLPLNPDAYFLFSALHPGSPPLGPSAGVLSAAGTAQAFFTVPPGAAPALAGLLLHHAGLVLDPALGAAVLATNAVPVSLVP